MTGARHKWDRTGYSVTSRSCTVCWATGRRNGKGSTPWSTTLPDGTFKFAGVPPCPGTPWARREIRDGVRYVLARPGEEDISTVTPAVLLVLSYDAIVQMTGLYGAPLPKPAWDDLCEQWARVRYDVPRWVYLGDRFNGNWVTDEQIIEVGQAATEECVKAMEYPPLPRAAWDVLVDV